MTKKQKKTIKIPWNDFIKMGMAKIEEMYLITVIGTEIAFMKTRSQSSDDSCYELPDYIEVEIK